jgi:hypothetical protein
MVAIDAQDAKRSFPEPETCAAPANWCSRVCTLAWLDGVLPLLVWATILALLAVPVFAGEWQSRRGYRCADLRLPPAGKTGFTILPPETTGINFTNVLPKQRSTTNQIYLNGSGVALGDVDGDGLCDIYLSGLGGGSRLYRNLGDWRFDDITQASGVAVPSLDATGAALADVDGDGDLDLIVNSVGGGTHVLINSGNGQFSHLATLNSSKGATSLALGDLDGDGYLDLYICNYRAETIRDHPTTKFRIEIIDGKPVITGVEGRPVTEPDLEGRFELSPNKKIRENGEVDSIFSNDGSGRFKSVSFTDGTFLDEDGHPIKTAPHDWSLSAMIRDLNGDGAPDIYVCGDFDSPDRIWINDGRGRFRAIPRLALRTSSKFSMGIDVADLNRDGFDELFVSDMVSLNHQRRHIQTGMLVPTFLVIGEIEDRPQYMRNTLFLNRGDGTYAEIAQFSGLHASEWTWMPLFLDVDLDGYEDLIIPSGHERDAMNADVINQAEVIRSQRKLSNLEFLRLNNLFPRLASGNVAFRNRGDLTFEEASTAWGFIPGQVSQGMAMADLDNDGDLDLVVNNLNGPASVFRNDSIAPRVAVRLKGKPGNTRGIGAKITVSGGPVPQSQQIICGGRYLSSDDPIRTFAAGSLTNEMTIEVSWRSGLRSVVTGVKANRVYEIDETSAGPAPPVRATKPRPIFDDVSGLINHKHFEEPFDDFDRQPLLPKRLSQLGPGVCWHDLDGDGWDDLIIGSGRGGRLAVFRNDGQGAFVAFSDPLLDRTVTRDQTAVLGTDSTLLVGSSNYEDGLTNGGWLRIYDFKREKSGESILGQTSSCGPLAMADVDGDGSLDLFVGGRSVPGRWPEPATSILFRNTAGGLVPVQRWENLGLVSGAVFSDLNGDGKPELILACEWGPILIYENKNGKLAPWDATLTWPGTPSSRLDPGIVTSHASTFAQLIGWWNGVTTGDIDDDGRMDIIASNWGLNNRYKTLGVEGVRLYYGDFVGEHRVDLLEAYFDRKMNMVVLFRTLPAVGMAMPFVKERFPTQEAFGAASIADILGDLQSQSKELRLTTLTSMVFLNRGDHFEPRELPLEAQLAPAFAVCVADADGDGYEDVFLSQNFFAVQPELPRCDAGRGLWLRGDGAGGLTAMPGHESGVMVYGEQRGAAVCDYDADGRVDLVVSQNGAQTKLFHNTGAKRGLRVRLVGLPGNPAAVGACMRLVFGQNMGPAREIRVGSGYWSQDSSVQVMATPEPPTRIWVRWPGGLTTTNDIPKGALEIKLSQTTR